MTTGIMETDAEGTLITGTLGATTVLPVSAINFPFSTAETGRILPVTTLNSLYSAKISLKTGSFPRIPDGRILTWKDPTIF